MIWLDERVEDLLARWQELRAGQQEPTPEELCQTCPELTDEVKRRIASLQATDWMFELGSLDEPNSQHGSLPAMSQLGAYTVLGRIGEGGMGTVYMARHRKLDRLVALKLLPQSRLWERQAVARFEREMRTVGKLEHLNIVVAYDAGEAQGMHYLAMQFVEGYDVGQWIKQHRCFSITDACAIIAQAARGIQHAHEHGIIHRDIKPSNLILGIDGVVRVLDLGLALNDHTSSIEPLSGSEFALGTVEFMSPEQLNDSRSVTASADIYSLGATLYRMLCSCSPLDTPGPQTRLQKMNRLATGQLVPIAKRQPELPTELCRLVDQMLSITPSQRPPTADEVAEALQPFAAGSDLVSLVASLEPSRVAEEVVSPRPQPAVQDIAPPDQPHHVQRFRHRTSRKSFTLLMTLGLLTLTLTAVMIYLKTERTTLVIKIGDEVTVEASTAPARQVVDVTVSPPSLATLRHTLIGHQAAVWNAVFSADQSTLYSTSQDGSVRVWDLESGQPTRVLLEGPAQSIASLQLLDNDSTLVVGGKREQSLRFVDIASAKVFRAYVGHRYLANNLDLSADGRWLVSHSRTGAVLLWDLEQGTSKKLPITGRCDARFVLDDRFLLYHRSGQPLRLLNLQTHDVERVVAPQHNVLGSVGLASDGRTIAFATTLSSGLVWDLDQDQQQMQFNAQANQIVADSAITPTAQCAIWNIDRTQLQLVDVSSGQPRGVIQGDQAWIQAHCLSPDGRLLAVCGNDSTIRIFELAKP